MGWSQLERALTETVEIRRSEGAAVAAAEEAELEAAKATSAPPREAPNPALAHSTQAAMPTRP
ncbi:MAG: hypothetical protein J6386_00235 [Candidatus Synoicihabitans palmerolidicus]|nr:hypothetical protein [Candidatus Synoicihabitans palmerolidicus]